MVKKVVKPARSSVVNLAFRISLGFDGQLCYPEHMVLTYMARPIQVEVFSNKGARDPIIECGLVALEETHCCRFTRKIKTGWWRS
jgi:hypothetical protein